MMPPTVDRASKVQNPVEQTMMTNNSTGSMACSTLNSRQPMVPKATWAKQASKPAQTTATTRTAIFSDQILWRLGPSPGQNTGGEEGLVWGEGNPPSKLTRPGTTRIPKPLQQPHLSCPQTHAIT